jgi:asparagine synthase (glutamine-hydrolysing)
MCGIAGIYSYSQPVVFEKIKTMTDVLTHRGPDGEGQWLSPNKKVGFGHRRLSIIDLSENGKQPMHYLERYSITFNGEIYNYLELKEKLLKKGYQFHSKTDTEVLLALYDSKKELCLDDIDGMFAFAIWDEKEQTLFCARDRFGEKPFFYHNTKENFVFASEIKALIKVGISKEINNTRLINYLVNDAIEDIYDNSTTFYKEIISLEAGHYIKIDSKGLTIKKYYHLSLKETNKCTPKEADEEFKRLFKESVKLRTISSDVAVGTSLSGGIDSSIIFHEINQIRTNVQTFTASFPGFSKDETELVKLLHSNYKATAHFAYPDAESYSRDLDALFYHQDEPVINANIHAQWCVYKLAKENGVTVLLDGQGADEIFAGYHYYFKPYLQQLMLKSKSQYKKEIDLYTSSPFFNKDKYFYIEAFAPKLFHHYKTARNYFSSPPADINAEYYTAFKQDLFPPKFLKPVLNEYLNYNLFYSGFEHLLRYGDRSSMAFSREVRLPFLSHKLVEFAYSLPFNLKVHNGYAKYIERSSYNSELPKEIIWKRDKIGYEAPQGTWIEHKALKEKTHHSIQTLIEKKILSANNYDRAKWWRYIQIAKLLEQ